MSHVAPGPPLRVGCGPYHCGGAGEGGGREGLTPSELGAGGSGARGTPRLWHLDGHRTLTRTTLHAGRLLSADFRVPPRRWYDPPVWERVPHHQPGAVSEFLSSGGPLSSWARFRSLVEGTGGNPAPLWKLRPREEGAQRGGLARWLQGHPGESRGDWRWARRARPARRSRAKKWRSGERSGGGAAGAAETLGVTQAPGAPRPLGCGWKESREPARRRRAVGVGGGEGEEREPQCLGRRTQPLKPSPCPQKQGDSGLRAKEEGN